MRPLILLALSLSLSLPLLAGCGPAEPAVVHGDVFLVEDLGQYINLTGLPVYLLQHDAELDSALARLCPTRDGARAAQSQAEAWTLRNDLLASMATDSAVTDEGARYAMETGSGRYHIWADTVLGTRRWTWLEPVRLRRGDTMRVNLTNDNADENPFRC